MRYEWRKIVTQRQLCALLLLVVMCNAMFFYRYCTRSTKGYTPIHGFGGETVSISQQPQLQLHLCISHQAGTVRLVFTTLCQPFQHMTIQLQFTIEITGDVVRRL